MGDFFQPGNWAVTKVFTEDMKMVHGRYQYEYRNIIMYKEEDMIKLGQDNAVGGCC